MNKRKLSVKNFINDFQDNTHKSQELKYNSEDYLKNNKFNMKNLILNESNSNIDEYNELKKILDSASSCQISDALKTISNKHGVIKGIKSINNKKTYGIVFTVETESDDWGTSILAIDQAKKGDFLLLYSKGDITAIWGELASKYAEKKGIVGTCIYGASRDIDALVNIEFPVFSLNTTPNAGNPKGNGRLNIDLEIDNEIISPGDFIFGDENGVVIVPKDLFSEVIYQTNKIKNTESKLIKEIQNGKSLSDIVMSK